MPINVLVVDDSAFMRKVITEILESDPRFKVVATARDGEVALKRVREHDIDLITLDIEMPRMGGLTFLEKLMAEKPLPVLMISALTQRGSQATLDALDRGAVDFVPKPSAPGQDMETIRDELLRKARAAARARVRLIQPPSSSRPPQQPLTPSSQPSAPSAPRAVTPSRLLRPAPRSLRTETRRSPERSPERSTERSPERPPERPIGHPSERPSDRFSDRLPDRLSDRPVDRSSDRPSNQPASRPSDSTVLPPSVQPSVPSARAGPGLTSGSGLASGPSSNTAPSGGLSGASSAPSGSASSGVSGGALSGATGPRPAKVPIGGPPRVIVAIGASTGGPRAVEQVLCGLPADLPVTIMITQHMPAGFTASYANRLDERCHLHVREGREDDRLLEGMVFIAPGGYHMTVDRGGRIRLNQDPPVCYVRPSADVMMKSIAEVYGPNVIGVVLTGMGRDGAQGMKAIAEAGGRTIVQDEATSVIFSMPAAVIAAGYAEEVVPLPEMSSRIAHHCRELYRRAEGGPINKEENTG